MATKLKPGLCMICLGAIPDAQDAEGYMADEGIAHVRLHTPREIVRGIFEECAYMTGPERHGLVGIILPETER